MLRMLLHALKFDRQICRCVVMMHDGIRVWVVAERDGGRMTLQSVYSTRHDNQRCWIQRNMLLRYKCVHACRPQATNRTADPC